MACRHRPDAIDTCPSCWRRARTSALVAALLGALLILLTALHCGGCCDTPDAYELPAATACNVVADSMGEMYERCGGSFDGGRAAYLRGRSCDDAASASSNLLPGCLNATQSVCSGVAPPECADVVAW